MFKPKNRGPILLKKQLFPYLLGLNITLSVKMQFIETMRLTTKQPK